MDFLDHFTTGIALRLQAQGVGVWRPTTAYLPDDVAITKTVLPQTPDQAIALAAYDVANAPSLSDTTLGLQVRSRGIRGDVAGGTSLGSLVFDALHGAHDFRLPSPDETPGVWVVQAMLRSSVSAGVDGNDRWSYIQNFYVDVHGPSPNRT